MDLESEDGGSSGSCSSDPESGSSVELVFLEPGGNVSKGGIDIDVLKQQLEEEAQVENRCKFIETAEKKMDRIIQHYEDLYDRYIVPSYQDLTNMFTDGNVFLVCGDSLILNAMGNSNYCLENGGQMLHLVYLCERLLQLFLRKGGAFEFVFFDIWKDTWLDNHSVLLARSVIIAHLQKNTSVPIHQFTAIWDPEFSRFLTMHKPGFLLVDLNLPDVYRQIFPNSDFALVDLSFRSQVLFSVAFNLPCADMGEVHLDVSTLHAFVVHGKPRLKKPLLETLNYVKVVIKANKLQSRSWNTEFEPQYYEAQQDARRILTVTAAAWYLIEETTEIHAKDWVRTFLLYSALMEVLPLRHRGCSLPTMKSTENLTRFIAQIQCHMNRALESISDIAYSYYNVPDLWHGNLFVNTLSLLRDICGLEDVSHFGTLTWEIYKILACEVGKIMQENFDILQITESNLNWDEVGFVVEVGNKTSAAASSSSSASSSASSSSKKRRKFLEKLIPTSCLLTHEFCGELLNEMHEQTREYDSRINMFVARERNFTEIHHWHSHKPLTDEQDRIKNTCLQVKSMSDWEKKRFFKHKAIFARFMNFYGSNIEGRHLISKPIVCKKSYSTTKEKSKNKASSKQKQGKVSKRALQIIEANKKDKQQSVKQIEEGKFSEFKKSYKAMKSKGNYEIILRDAKRLLEKLHTGEYIQKALLYIAEMYYMLWCDECSAKQNPLDRDLNLAKELFLVLRRLLQESKKNEVPLPDADKRHVGLWLWRLGFKEVAQLWEVPQPEEDKSYEVGTSWIRFQLLHLGPELERTSEGKPDDRVDFIPDPWQKELFDVIDHHQSAVIVAPTSSGKTYASYYCMESILREDNEGVVVYVAPTKALVNQVAATVYARFKGKDMPDGKAVYGVFTRDYRTNDMNSQILITVPQCLELLLLSPRRHTWVKKLRYVIFDEIHCLAGQAGGVSWECGLLLIRCPFLALSATVHKPEILYEWLQSAENLKQQRDKLDGCERPPTSYKVRLVVHQERHNDLKKYVYTASRTFLHIHPYAHVDMTVIKEHRGIPGHISLSPEEALQLYVAMESVSIQDADIIHFMPETYFKSSGFVTRPEVREYERHLRDVLQKWAFEDQTAFESVLKQLNLKLGMANNDECGMDFIATNFIKFIQDLQKEKMFPAIIFRYDKGDLEYLFKNFITYCSKLEQEDERKTTKQRSNGLNDKKRKELKSLCQSVGQSSKAMENASGIGDVSLRRRQPVVDNTSLGLLEGQSSGSIRNVGVVDEDDLKFIERRLMIAGHKRSDDFLSGLRMGMGIHHAAMSAKERSTVEMLFRMKVLNVVLATGTLALGIHMPCKTVVIAGDGQFVNSLEFHQMSGRAGRRGFDTSGNVVFFGLSERKTRTLLTGKLPIMIGNFPLTVTLVLRLLLLVSDVTDKGCPDEKATSDALSRALTYLNCSLVYQSVPELKPQMKHFFSFTTQLLILQGLLDNQGIPQKLTGLITHLHYHEPGNLVLVYLLRSGALRRLCRPEENGVISKATELNLVLVLSYLFARHPLHASCLSRKYDNSTVILPPLPHDIQTEMENYNEEVGFIYDHYFQCVARHFAESMGDDDTLPLSRVCINPVAPAVLDAEASNFETLVMRKNEPRKICSAFAALSGHTDRNLYSHNNIISNIRHQVFTDVKVVPVLDYDLQLNAYAWDFYNHGIVAAIMKDNGIRSGDAFTLLNDFRLALRTIYICLEELVDEDDDVLQTFKTVANKFGYFFNKAFNLKDYSPI